ncbi:MAG: hypothetical protein AAGJ85_05260, partial [Pseudomonadota bacterium]
MRWIAILCFLSVALVTAHSEEVGKQPIIYLVELDNIKVVSNLQVNETSEADLPSITFTTGCRRVELELTVILSNVSLPENMTISPERGWCRDDFEAPFDEFLIFADGSPDNFEIVLHADSLAGEAF